MKLMRFLIGNRKVSADISQYLDVRYIPPNFPNIRNLSKPARFYAKHAANKQQVKK